MARSVCVLLEAGDGWYLHAVGALPGSPKRIGSRSTTGVALADLVHEQCQLRGIKNADLVVAVHADSVVCAALPDGSTASVRDRAALVYQLEPQLPFDAEDVVVDFAGQGESLIAVAVRHAGLLAFVAAIEERAARVQSLVPAALAAVQNVADTDGVFVWRTNDAVELVEVQNNDLCAWYHLPNDAGAVARELRLRGFAMPSLITDPAREPDGFAETIAAGSTNQRAVADEVAQFATRVLSGHTSPWIELRRDALANGDPNRPYRSALNLLTVAGLALVIFFIAACWWRAGKYSDEAQGYAREHRELYKSAFPGKRLPRAPLSRLRSEHARLLGARGAGDVKLPVSVVGPTFHLLSGLKSHRARVSELRVQDGGFDLTVQVKNFNDVAALKRSIEQQGFVVEVGSQDTDNDGFVVTTLKGLPATAASTAAGQP